MTTQQNIDYSTQSNTSPGVLPNFDGGQATSVVYLASPSGNAPFVSNGAWTVAPTQAGAVQGAYHQWNAGTRVTEISLSWQFTENKNGNNTGPVICVLHDLLPAGLNGNIPPIACHFGVGMQSWHIDTMGFFGLSPVLTGTFSPFLVYNTTYTMKLTYTAADTVKLTLPDGTVKSGIQNSQFNSNAGTCGFTEIYLGNAINESNVKITHEEFDVAQWPGSTPPPVSPGLEYYQPVCRNDSQDGGYLTTHDLALAWANTHIQANPGHIVDIKDVEK